MEEKYKKILEKKVPEIMKIKGKERAADIKYLVKYIKEKEGEKGFNALIRELGKYNFKLPDVDDLNSMEWIPANIARVFSMSALHFFNWTEEEVFDMGKNFITYSKPFKIFIKFFLSPKKTIEKGVKKWNKYFTEGSLDLVEFDKKNKECILEVKDFGMHPVLAIYFQGIFTKILEITTGSKNVTIKGIENKNERRYHKFKAKW